MFLMLCGVFYSEFFIGGNTLMSALIHSNTHVYAQIHRKYAV